MITRKNEQKISIREYMRGGKKHVKLAALSNQLPENARLFSVLTLIPGASIGYHVHENETEMFYFIEGCGRVQDATIASMTLPPAIPWRRSAVMVTRWKTLAITIW